MGNENNRNKKNSNKNITNNQLIKNTNPINDKTNANNANEKNEAPNINSANNINEIDLPEPIFSFFYMNNIFLDNNRVPENMTIKDLKNFIYTKVYIPIYRQILFFDNTKISNEETQLRNINYRHFEMKFNDIPHENDFIDIEIEDYRFYNNHNKTGNFI